jgi:hypothetical protein
MIEKGKDLSISNEWFEDMLRDADRGRNILSPEAFSILLLKEQNNLSITQIKRPYLPGSNMDCLITYPDGILNQQIDFTNGSTLCYGSHKSLNLRIHDLLKAKFNMETGRESLKIINNQYIKIIYVELPHTLSQNDF